MANFQKKQRKRSVQYCIDIFIKCIKQYLSMVLLKSDILKIKILKTLRNKEDELSMNSLRKKVGSINYHSLTRNCEFLEKVNYIRIETKKSWK